MEAAVICAAGLSSRMGGEKKEYQKLKHDSSLTVLGSAARAFAAVKSVEIIAIVIPEDEERLAREALSPDWLASSKAKILFVAGGSSRRASVLNALSLLEAYNPEFVLIHDGARPWVSPSLIKKIIEEVKKHSAVIPMISLVETPKECAEPLSRTRAVFIKNHLKRSLVGVAQTPQGFKFPEILYAHKKAAELESERFTDDAEIWGRFIGQVAVIPGEKENRKITFPEDLA